MRTNRGRILISRNIIYIISLTMNFHTLEHYIYEYKIQYTTHTDRLFPQFPYTHIHIYSYGNDALPPPRKIHLFFCRRFFVKKHTFFFFKKKQNNFSKSQMHAIFLQIPYKCIFKIVKAKKRKQRKAIKIISTL